jgi:hypothetical protein
MKRLLAHELYLSSLAVAVLCGLYVGRAQHGIPSPGGGLGHSLGVIGFLMMLSTETLYTLRKRSRRFTWGRMSVWLKVHIFTGIVGPCLVFLHTGWRFHGLAGVLTLLTVVIVVSGFIGRYIFTAIPRSLDGREIALGDLEARIARTSKELESLGVGRLRDAAQRISDEAVPRGWRLVLGRHYYRWRLRRRLRRLAGKARGEKRATSERLVRLLLERYRLRVQAASLVVARRLLALWHIVHIPIGGALFTLAFIHIVGAIYYATFLKW